MENRTISKQQLAYDKIKEAIITEKYKADQLLSTRELSTELNISRTPVAAALRRLAYEGFVDEIQDKGMFVSRVQIEDFIELYEIKMGMEGVAARLCAVRKTDGLIRQLEDALLQYETEVKKGNYLKAVQKDNEFHVSFIAGAKNTRLENYLRIVLEQCSLAVTLSASDPIRMETVILPAHRKIFDAIVAGEPDLAENAAREHVVDVQDFFTQYQIKHHYVLK
ncbi:DNA-binding transcriptional regulator, GntR family [Sporobacter termitidis DSM 10068]|uniref:DNA-binding transcriptional regulator, GntR family n=1 Tax=Sporobacter termitidis DSM 10068 TaxID=1123282 RepID=A0A1M5WKJ5_9FIRM|nr:GntR family transcriptional regulator [Sporobacter termitidis]SHH87694.1 DNA-binding transcriptional regulator, GntR family [Sporobacter termitidis DSM 10068]